MRSPCTPARSVLLTSQRAVSTRSGEPPNPLPAVRTAPCTSCTTTATAAAATIYWQQQGARGCLCGALVTPTLV